MLGPRRYGVRFIILFFFYSLFSLMAFYCPFALHINICKYNEVMNIIRSSTYFFHIAQTFRAHLVNYIYIYIYIFFFNLFIFLFLFRRTVFKNKNRKQFYVILCKKFLKIKIKLKIKKKKERKKERKSLLLSGQLF